MKGFLKYCIIILFFTNNFFLFSQTDSSYIKTEEVIDELILEPQEEADNEQLYEIFEELLDDPININSADLSELQRLPYIDASYAELIINHRKTFGNFFSPQELYSIKDLPNEITNKIIPFVTVPEINFNKEIPDEDFWTGLTRYSRVYIRNRMIRDIQESKGYKESKYAGNPFKFYNRIKARVYENFEFGFLTEKDAGEVEFNEFNTFFLGVENLSFINKGVIGDYILEFGQGLALWRPYGFSKGSDAVYPVKKKSRVIKENSSANENNFFRGAAGSFNIGDFSLTAFYSKNKFDANIDTTTGEILSTPVAGLHRTEGELLRKKTADEKVFGGILNYSMENVFNIGLLYYNSQFSNPFLQEDIYGISGKNFNFYSLKYDIYLNNLNVFGESTFNGTSVASLAGLQYSISSTFAFITSFRNYPRNFISLHGLGFGERSGATQNETGFYTGLRLRTGIGVFNLYYDQFKFPYASYRNPLPGNGYEYLLYYSHKPLRKLETRFKFKFEKKDIQEDTGELSNIITKRLKQNFRVELIYELSKDLRFKGRFEYIDFLILDTDIHENGFLFYQDIRYLPVKNLTLYGRIIFFKTESFNSAIYEYENNLTGLFTNSAMFGEGMRWYIILRYKLFSYLTLSGKYSETYKPSLKSIGSGNEEIEGNLDNRLSIQLDIRF